MLRDSWVKMGWVVLGWRELLSLLSYLKRHLTRVGVVRKWDSGPSHFEENGEFQMERGLLGLWGFVGLGRLGGLPVLRLAPPVERKTYSPCKSEKAKDIYIYRDSPRIFVINCGE